MMRWVSGHIGAGDGDGDGRDVGCGEVSVDAEDSSGLLEAMADVQGV